ncbi:MAG: DUF4376 domain-containing protein [Aquabacterium sp.]
MITVHLVDMLGEQVGSVSGSSVPIIELNLQPGLTPILFPPPTPDALWDFTTFLWVPRPPQPSADHVWDPQAREWVFGLTLEQVKDRKWSVLKEARDRAETGTFVWRGHVLDADKARITGAASGAFIAQSLGLPYADTWTLADNSTIPVTAADMIDIGLTLMQHVSACHARGRQLRQQLNEATTVEQVEALQW